MTELYRERYDCRLCCAESLELVMRLEPTPIGDKYLPESRKEETREMIPLDLFLCDACGHLQTGAIINPERIYTHYLSRPSAVNPILSDSYREYAENILSRYAKDKDGLVVEFGSNDGVFLGFLKEEGKTVLGVDPAGNLAEAASERGIETISAFFSSKVAQEISKSRGRAEVIVANFVFANIDDVQDVVSGVRELLAPDGVFSFETNNRLDIFSKHLIETINHEHLSYYSAKSLASFFAQHGLELIDTERVPSKGGSIRCAVQHAGGPYAKQQRVQDLIDLEESQGLYTSDFYSGTAKQIRSAREEIRTFLEEEKSAGKSFAGYGTSIGATILIYQLGLGEYLDFLVDDDPYRQNLVSPGYHLPVVDGAELRSRKTDYVLVLAPLYADQIIAKNADYVDQGGHFVSVWPSLEVRT